MEHGSQASSNHDLSAPPAWPSTQQSDPAASLEAEGPFDLTSMPLTHPTLPMSELVVRLLIADENGRSRLNHVLAGGGNTLHFAIKRGDIQLARFALDNGADPDVKDEDGNRPLHLAADGTLEMVKLLLERLADPNLSGGLITVEALGRDSHLTPLHVAVSKGNTQVVRQLLKKGANVNAPEPFSFWTPLSFAVYAGHAEIVHLLLANGANVDGDRSAFETPLIRAVLKKRIDLVQTLYCCGADLNRRDGDGDPSIHNAAANGSLDLVKLILGVSDEDLDLKGTSGRPAWWFAQKYDHIEIMNLLRKKETGTIREFPRDISDDSRSSIATIGPSRLLKDIALAETYIYAAQVSSLWKNRIRFVVQAPPGQKDYALEVIEPYVNGKDSQEPFVAVSYCWASQDKYLGEQLWVKVPRESGTGSTIRPARARPDVILRCLEFAHSKGIQRIWIDQECIHQNDMEDKKILVGTMHRLYRQATLTVAVLGNHIKSAEDVQAVSHFRNDTPFLHPTNTESSKEFDIHEHTRIVVRRIFEDRWFTRAWTTQEAFSAQWDVENLVYLVGWDRNFDRAGSLWHEMTTSLPESFLRQTVKRNLLLDNKDIWDMAVVPHGGGDTVLSTATQMVTGGNKTFTLSARSLETYNRDYIRRSPGVLSRILPSLLELVPDFLSRTFSRRTLDRRCDGDYSTYKSSLTETSLTECHAMEMAAVFFTLREKRNLMVSDRPSIFANLARYQRHLDMRGLVQTDHDISYTACVLALALANGDLSFLLSDSHWTKSDSSASKPSWLPSSLKLGKPVFAPGNIWAGKVTEAGNPCVVVDDFLVARGVLWKVQPCEDLSTLQDEIKRSIERCEQNLSDARDESVTILKATLKELFRQEKEHLVTLFITLARRRKWTSPAEIDCSLLQLRNWYYRDGNWPSQVEPTSTQAGVETIFDCDKVDDVIPEIWGDPLLRWIYWRVLNGASFPLGSFDVKQENATEDIRQEYAIFRLNLEGCAWAFVPMAHLNYEFKGSTFLQQESAVPFWRVDILGASTISDHDRARASEGLKRSGLECPQISQKALIIKRDSDLLGFWSPFLCASGVLNLDEKLGSYCMIPLGNSATYHMIL